MKHNGNSPLEAGNHIVGCTECAQSYVVRRGHEVLKVLELGSTAGPHVVVSELADQHGHRLWRKAAEGFDAVTTPVNCAPHDTARRRRPTSVAGLRRRG